MLFCRLCHKRNILKSYSIDSFNYYLCQNCQVLFLYPQPTTKVIKDFYVNKYKQEAALDRKNELIKRSKIIIKKLLKLNPAGKTLLDIGSGYGYFLNEARKHNLKVLGIEPSIFLYRHSVKNFKLPILNQTFEEYIKRNKKDTFDFIILIHVIEHIPDPKTFINKTAKLLKPGGILYIETPNLNSHLFFSEKQRYTFLTPPDHLYIFSLQCFETSKNCIQLQLISYSTYSYPEHLMGIIKRYFIPTTLIPQSPAKRDQVEPTNLVKKLKYLFFDLFLAKVFYRLLNLNNKGSILEFYYKKL